jgi:hypothetical protein
MSAQSQIALLRTDPRRQRRYEFDKLRSCFASLRRRFPRERRVPILRRRPSRVAARIRSAPRAEARCPARQELQVVFNSWPNAKFRLRIAAPGSEPLRSKESPAKVGGFSWELPAWPA